jgi:hypothetical protein
MVLSQWRIDPDGSLSRELAAVELPGDEILDEQRRRAETSRSAASRLARPRRDGWLKRGELLSICKRAA